MSTFSRHTAQVKWAAWSPDGSRVVTASQDDTVKVWDASTGVEILSFASPGVDILVWDEEETGPAPRAAWSPSGDLIAAGGGDGTAQVWDASTSSPTYGEKLLTLAGHTDHILHVAWSSDGARIATTSVDGTAKIWDATTGTELVTAEVLDANTGEELVTFTGHTRNVLRIQWACKGERLFTYSADDTVRVWDAATGAELLRYDVEGYVEAALSPDETRIAMSITPPGLLKVFPAWQTLEELMDYARECCVVRELTDAEREMLGLPPR